MWLKACKRCGGDLYRREEPEGIEITCMQCSRIYSAQQLIQEVPAVADAARVLAEVEADEAAEMGRVPVAA